MITYQSVTQLRVIFIALQVAGARNTKLPPSSEAPPPLPRPPPPPERQQQLVVAGVGGGIGWGCWIYFGCAVDGDIFLLMCAH